MPPPIPTARRGRNTPARASAAVLHRAARRLRDGARRLCRSRFVHGVARSGFVAKAVVYGLIGAYALRLALGRRGATLDPKGALAALTAGPLGVVAVALVSAGIAGLGLWFVVDAVGNPSRGRGLWSFVSRAGQAGGGLGYLALAVVGAHLARGEGAGPSGDALARGGAASLMAQPGGGVPLAIVGLAVAAVGARQVWLGLSRGFLAALDLSRAAPRFRRWVGRAGTAGFAVQGTLLALAGAFLVGAVLRRDPGEASSTAGVLGTLWSGPAGPTLLGLAAGGLLVYALYAGIEGAFRRFPCGAPDGRARWRVHAGPFRAQRRRPARAPRILEE